MLAAGFHTLYVRLRSAPQAALLLIPAADRCLRLHRLRLPCRHRTARPPFPAPRALSAARLVHRDRTVPRPVIPPAPTPRVRIRRAHIAHAPCRAPILRAPPKPARLADEVLKLQTFSFYQSISNFVVSLPNGGEKDVKGLLFRK